MFTSMQAHTFGQDGLLVVIHGIKDALPPRWTSFACSCPRYVDTVVFLKRNGTKFDAKQNETGGL
jgi:hypothetical protein